MSEAISQLRVSSGFNRCSRYAVWLYDQLQLNESMIEIPKTEDRGPADNVWPIITTHVFCGVLGVPRV